ncbi:MAG: AAA family ATPase [Candidatus Caldarchaeum sp.]|nr:AAA family ATPase [Candidatus Caldarchaeum sp.]
MIIWVSGTPGVGKTAVGKNLARRLGYEFIDVPVFVRDEGLGEAEKPEGTIVVEPRVLRQRLLSRAMDEVVISSHLLMKLPRRKQKCIVLRHNPLKLVKRLRMRRYNLKKVAENAEAEFLGIIYQEAVKTFGRRRVFQVDTTGKSVSEVSRRCLSLLRGRSRGENVDWLRDLSEKELERLLLFLARRRSVVF